MWAQRGQLRPLVCVTVGSYMNGSAEVPATVMGMSLDGYTGVVERTTTGICCLCAMLAHSGKQHREHRMASLSL